ncbi:GAF domain-containing protein [Methylobacterium iners]|uniref:Uncharacterized protein n=1 Tax=Methylobacterium iners TaxID=418707 RepID=A0ABQ4RVL2_9HYPH|nr:GAF domain-containing protein [Methylobacterium iners]GJD94631.1 hypothetical protein OCOJLMKI_1834 [Methylobacterium iners]
MKSGHAALRALGTPSCLPDGRSDTIRRTAGDLLGVPIAPASIIDADRQWFEGRCDPDVEGIPRDASLCVHAIMGDDAMVVEEARADPRFCEPGMAERETERRRAAAGR